MGTTYEVLKSGDLEVTIDEMSNRFALNVDGPASEVSFDREEGRAFFGTRNTIPTLDLVTMAVKILQIASYWEEEEIVFADFHKKCEAAYLIGVCKSAGS